MIQGNWKAATANTELKGLTNAGLPSYGSKRCHFFLQVTIPVANFSLAVKEVYKNGDGEKKTNTLWIHCVAWRRWAEIVGEHVSKGKFLYVEGRLQLRVYEDREGQKRNVTEVVVSTLRFLGSAKNGNGAKPAEPSKAADPVDEGDNPFEETGGECRKVGVPF
jgi:single-strand DNA-binding protein